MVAETIITRKHEDAANENNDILKGGRPRSEKARKAILEAARKLLAQRSMNDLTIEAIAKKAKVGKTTIYRWWPSKAAVAMEALLEQPELQDNVPQNGNAPEIVAAQLASLVRQMRGQNGKIIAGIIAEGQSDMGVQDLMYERFLKERVGNLYDAVERGQADGSFRAIDLDIAVDMLLGPLFLRILSGEHGIDDSFAARYPQQAVAGLLP